ncbi:NUDIX domain-containing protein [Streptomyces brevispora]|uniref:NUDIX domain-containing protein n=1 Tax=Streptomyces brevispora TaxID=887462 RepID=A0A561V4F5_9ACTN|nr:NUDIX domain-containing protein [Streptomyces brevispora]TWG06494.1 NUDIX domain-containing protein [Streptomyces brevispora]
MPTDKGSFTVSGGVEVPVPLPGTLWTVGAVILNEDGAAFAQKRSPDRRLFPDTWDIVGGHVEAGEPLLNALAREVEEETGWRLRHVRRFLGTSTWTGDDGGACATRRTISSRSKATWAGPPWSGPSTPPTAGSPLTASTASGRTAAPGSS